jgi:hypothetical protein
MDLRFAATGAIGDPIETVAQAGPILLKRAMFSQNTELDAVSVSVNWVPEVTLVKCKS